MAPKSALNVLRIVGIVFVVVGVFLFLVISIVFGLILLLVGLVAVFAGGRKHSRAPAKTSRGGV
jgi:predicted membrane protein